MRYALGSSFERRSLRESKVKLQSEDVGGGLLKDEWVYMVDQLL
jgi:hypothetical protein